MAIRKLYGPSETDLARAKMNPSGEWLQWYAAATADTPEATLVEARDWTWEQIGRRNAFIREAPEVVSETDFETKVTTHRAITRFSVQYGMDEAFTGFGELKEVA